MRTALDAGEPISKGRVDRRVTEARALRDALLGVALFAGVMLVNAILAILFIARRRPATEADKPASLKDGSNLLTAALAAASIRCADKDLSQSLFGKRANSAPREDIDC